MMVKHWMNTEPQVLTPATDLLVERCDHLPLRSGSLDDWKYHLILA